MWSSLRLGPCLWSTQSRAWFGSVRWVRAGRRPTKRAGTAQDANREAHLLFETGGRFTGSDGCDRIAGTYELKGDVVGFMPATEPAFCGRARRAFRCIRRQRRDRQRRAATSQDPLPRESRRALAGRRLNCTPIRGGGRGCLVAQHQTGASKSTRAQKLSSVHSVSCAALTTLPACRRRSVRAVFESRSLTSSPGHVPSRGTSLVAFAKQFRCSSVVPPSAREWPRIC
jgi:hypothetical protein